MIDRLFTATLTFCLLIGGTLAIGSAMLGLDQPGVATKPAAPTVRSVQLERVVVIGKRLVPAAEMAQTDPADAPTAARLQ